MKSLIVVFLTLLSLNASAGVIGAAKVVSEGDHPSYLTQCNVQTSISAAAVESVMRQNRIAVSTSPDSKFFVFLTNSILPINDNFCAAHYSLEIQFFGPVKAPFQEEKEILGIVVLCADGGIEVNSKVELQRVLNEKYRSAMEQCVSKIEKI